MKKSSKVRWSYSQLAVYERCPLAWRFGYRDRLPRGPQHPSALRGQAIHQELELFLGNPRARKLPASLARLKDPVLDAKREGALPEEEIFLDRAWRRTTEKKAWGVVIPDAHWVRDGALHVRDLKTGRERDYTDQLRTYLAGLIGLYPEATVGHAALWYSDADKAPRAVSRPVIFIRTVLEGIRRELAIRVDRMEKDRAWEPTPSASACRWCDFSRLRGGPCVKG